MNTSRKYRRCAWNNYREVSKTKHYGMPMFVNNNNNKTETTWNGVHHEVNMIKYWKYMEEAQAISASTTYIHTPKHIHASTSTHTMHTAFCFEERMYNMCANLFSCQLLHYAITLYQFRVLATDLSMINEHTHTLTIVHVFVLCCSLCHSNT